MHIEIVHHFPEPLQLKPEAVLLAALVELTKQVKQMAQELEDLQEHVSQNTTVIGSAITLIKGIKAKLDAAIASGVPSSLKALSAELGKSDNELAAAVAENTAAAGETPA